MVYLACLCTEETTKYTQLITAGLCRGQRGPLPASDITGSRGPAQRRNLQPPARVAPTRTKLQFATIKQEEAASRPSHGNAWWRLQDQARPQQSQPRTRPDQRQNHSSLNSGTTRRGVRLLFVSTNRSELERIIRQCQIKQPDRCLVKPCAQSVRVRSLHPTEFSVDRAGRTQHAPRASHRKTDASGGGIRQELDPPKIT